MNKLICDMCGEEREMGHKYIFPTLDNVYARDNNGNKIISCMIIKPKKVYLCSDCEGEIFKTLYNELGVTF